ncbi:hypothetical protein CANCADRAFT_28590 [Tortispora caseinolytica NRRL Y-17796]|uniref:Structural maintenance of chromosomes protein n=1 Tax=Tortispora caseinolytica NRRL Y-17796 TaxID=767744 RepID=A0A1E4TCH7_9ASCO|nr:hypothetical protein CANCADRAFT_28590 [Tortispora caseinolytica NRRL Y-17796]
MTLKRPKLIPRLVISHLVLNNFKSYAGQQIIGPFHESFSAVVGPNGSGKSNVIDSLLFVFGFRSSKMRQTKLSALIHKSSAAPDCRFCSVEVHFREVIDRKGCVGEAVDEIPGSELVVSRTVTADNRSTYYVNEKSSSFTQVTDLLRSKGIDLDHKRFLILQGEVESIAQMKPKAQGDNDDGLLEYLEDIIGTSKYRDTIASALEDLEGADNVAAEANSRLDTARHQTASLKGARDIAMSRLKMQNELTLAKHQLYEYHLLKATQAADILSKVVAETDNDLQKLRSENSESIAKSKQMNDELKQTTAEHSQKAKVAKNASSRASKLEQSMIQTKEKLAHFESKKTKSEKAMQAAQLSLNESRSWISEYSAEIAQSEDTIESFSATLQTEKDKLVQIKLALQDKTSGFNKQIEECQANIDPLKTSLTSKTGEIAVLESQISAIHRSREKNEAALQAVEKRLLALEEELKEIDTKVEKSNQELEETNSILKIAETQCANAQEGYQKLQDELSGLRQKRDEAKSSLHSEESQGVIVSSLLRLKESGKLPGIFGRLGSLGSIDDKYDIAVSSACPSLNHIVVDTVETAQHCLEYLRKNNLGRANFLVLAKLPQRNTAPINTPENIPRLFDLVHFDDERLEPAFYHVLTDTLVAQDLSQANRVAYGAKRFKVVTLQGQVIDKSGTLSGGGTKVSKGLLKKRSSSSNSSDVNAQTVKLLEEETATLEKQFENGGNALKQMLEQFEQLKSKKPELERALRRFALDKTNAERNISAVIKEKEEIQAQLSPSSLSEDDLRLVELNSSKEKLEKETLKLSAEISKVQETISELEEKILEAGGVKLRTQQAKVDDMVSKYELASEKLVSSRKSLRKAELDSGRQQKIIDGLELDLAKLEEEMEESKKTLEEGSSQLTEVQDEADKLNGEVLELEGKMETLSSGIDELTSILEDFATKEYELTEKQTRCQKELAESVKACERHVAKIESLVLHNLRDYEEMEEDNYLPHYSADDVESFDIDMLKMKTHALEKELGSQPVAFNALADYKQAALIEQARRKEVEQAISIRNERKERAEDLKSTRLTEFMAGFEAISDKLKEMYQMITLGGMAELDLVDSLNPFSEGISFSVMPPKKSWKNITNLSGGEKTLSSLALVFALHHYKPTPLYVMDEIDAALDFRNVSIVARYIQQRTRNAQFIVISLRNDMFELSKRLVGIYKVNHMTQSVSLDNVPIEELEEESGNPEEIEL